MNRLKQPAARLTRRALVATICICLALVTVPFMAQSKKESKEAAKFRDQGAQARIAIEKARDQLTKTVEAYDTLLAANEKKLQSSHKKLAQEVTKTEKVVDEGRKQIETFQETADKFFANWETGVSDITTESIRAASEKRYEAALGGFQNMRDSLAAAREAYDPLIGSLREQVTLLEKDLSTETQSMLKDEVADGTHAQAEQVFASIEASLSKEKAEEDEVNQILDEEEAETGDDVMDGDKEEGEAEPEPKEDASTEDATPGE